MSSAENHDSNFSHGAVTYSKELFFNLKVYFIHSHLSGNLVESQRRRSGSTYLTLVRYQKVRFLPLARCFQGQDMRYRKNKQRRIMMHANFIVIIAATTIFVLFAFSSLRFFLYLLSYSCLLILCS